MTKDGGLALFNFENHQNESQIFNDDLTSTTLKTSNQVSKNSVTSNEENFLNLDLN